MVNPALSVSTIKQSSFNLLRIEEQLSAAHLRLARVYIENVPYAKLIGRYDKPHTFFYIDPPYYGYEDYYGKGIFGRDDFGKLADLLKEINGKFIMSINDTPKTRELFEGFNTEKVNTNYVLAGAHRKKKVTELLIMNYQPQP